MKLIVTSKYGEFKLLAPRGNAAEVTYPNYSPFRANIKIGESNIIVKPKFSIPGFLKVAFLGAKDYVIVKDEQEVGTIHLGHRDRIQIKWGKPPGEKIVKYRIVKDDKVKEADYRLLLEGPDKKTLMYLDYSPKWTDLNSEIELKFLPSDLSEEQQQELAVYLIQTTRLYYGFELDDVFF